MEKKEFQLMFYCLIWTFLTFIIYPHAAFLYSTAIVPLMIIIISQFLNLKQLNHRILLYTTVTIVIFNNAIQIMKFRDVLLTMS
jgi:hypothetical protein